MDKWEYQSNLCYLENRFVREPCKQRTACTYLRGLVIQVLHTSKTHFNHCKDLSSKISTYLELQIETNRNHSFAIKKSWFEIFVAWNLFCVSSHEQLCWLIFHAQMAILHVSRLVNIGWPGIWASARNKLIFWIQVGWCLSTNMNTTNVLEYHTCHTGSHLLITIDF